MIQPNAPDVHWSEYIENPKTKGSGILCAIPQKGKCPNECEDCFFQSGRSYLEPLDEHLPNMPPASLCNSKGYIVRMNDGNDSNVQRDLVESEAKKYDNVFFNTAIPVRLERFPGPVVLTANPGKMTNINFFKIPEPLPPNLMFVRFRTNTWNLQLAEKCIAYYTSKNIPVVLTFMAYWKYEGSIPKEHVTSYIKRKRVTNEYVAITTYAWRKVMRQFEDNPLVYSCGKIEGEKGKTGCRYCGNCIREYFAAKERMINDKH